MSINFGWLRIVIFATSPPGLCPYWWCSLFKPPFRSGISQETMLMTKLMFVLICFNGFKGQRTMAKSSISTKNWANDWANDDTSGGTEGRCFFSSHCDGLIDLTVGMFPLGPSASSIPEIPQWEHVTQAPARKMWWHLVVPIVKRCFKKNNLMIKI